MSWLWPGNSSSANASSLIMVQPRLLFFLCFQDPVADLVIRLSHAVFLVAQGTEWYESWSLLVGCIQHIDGLNEKMHDHERKHLAMIGHCMNQASTWMPNWNSSVQAYSRNADVTMSMALRHEEGKKKEAWVYLGSHTRQESLELL